MEYDQQIDEMSRSVASELLRLAATKNYPLNPRASLDSFFEGFYDWGVPVRLDDKSKKAWFDFKHDISGTGYLASVECSYQQILEGSGKGVIGSVQTLLSSASLIVGTSGKVLERNYGPKLTREQRADFVKYFNDRTDSFSSIFTGLLKKYFEKYHENVLISPEGGVPELKESEILPTVLDQVDWDEYGETLRDIGNNQNELSAFRGFFNILFFTKLIKTKGYPMREISYKQESYDPIEKFADGKDIPWRNLPVMK